MHKNIVGLDPETTHISFVKGYNDALHFFDSSCGLNFWNRLNNLLTISTIK